MASVSIAREHWQSVLSAKPVAVLLDILKDASKPKRYAILLIGGLTGFCVLRYAFWKLLNKLRGYPDGPVGLPLFGCALSFGTDPLGFLANTGATYGALAYFPLMMSNNVLISDPKVMRQLYKVEKFVDKLEMQHNRSPEIMVVNGSEWEFRRKLIMKTVMTIANTALVLRKVDNFITGYIEPELDAKHVQMHEVWQPRKFMAPLALNTVFTAAFGVALALSDPFLPEFSKRVEEYLIAGGSYLFVEQITNLNARYLVPDWLRWHITQKYHERTVALLSGWMNKNGFVVDIDKNIFRRADDNQLQVDHEDYQENLYVDVLIEAVSNGQMSALTAISEIVMVFLAATDTTATSSTYIIGLLAKHPKVQQMVVDEVQSVLQKNNLKRFDFSILNELHIFRAFIYEGLRIGTITPIGGIPRVTDKQCVVEVDGKRCVIPKGILLLPNQHYVHRYLDWSNNNEPLTEENSAMHLEYWLQDGKFKMNENFVLFGMGRRDCAGQSLEMRNLYAIFGLLLSKYKFVAPNNDPDSMVFKQKFFGITAVLDPPMRVQVESRYQ
eukprot:CAMPEP_0197023646 /NCGR_PEP_ID=MMETSP1384-20130603/4313_1 /TAXON_ID=29189 /ORGANISM="Ammonia sp." /LENGTH=553 /DNA_ID=CAMNT_0042451891 /DNA_START=23 /DNA_END=1684 /DNA_ORIENTATION=+